MSNIQSISDIITNSSSEVFIIDSERHDKIEDFLTDVCNIFGWRIDDLMSFDSANQDGVIDGWGIEYKKDNLLIWSCEENSIPYILMQIIEELPWISAPTLDGVKVNNVKREHLG